MLAKSRGAVMTCSTAFCNIGMIIFSIRTNLQEIISRVAVTAFGTRLDMGIGFTDSPYSIMTSAAFTKNLDMVGIASYVKSEGSVAGLTHIAGGDVIAGFGHYCRKWWHGYGIASVMAFRALRCIACVKMFAGEEIVRGSGLDGSNGTLAGYTFDANDKLYHIGACHIGNEARIG